MEIEVDSFPLTFTSRVGIPDKMCMYRQLDRGLEIPRDYGTVSVLYTTEFAKQWQKLNTISYPTKIFSH